MMTPTSTFLSLLLGSTLVSEQQLLTRAFLVPAALQNPSTLVLYHSPPSSSAAETVTRPAPLQVGAAESPGNVASGVAADDNVPEGHKGLHEFLYGDDDAHGTRAPPAGSTSTSFTRAQGPFPAASFLKDLQDTRLAAVYGVYDASGTLRYVGVTRNVVMALEGHLQAHGPEVVASVALESFRYPKREEMAAVQASWLEEVAATGQNPEGNRSVGEGGSGGWAKSIREVVESGAGLGGAHADTKTKLRTAMADPTLRDELEDLDEEEEYGEEAEAARSARRAQLKAAVEESDWSGMIEGQTRSTIPEGTRDAAAKEVGGEITSPFREGGAGSPSSPPPASPPSSSLPAEDTLELTPENVDRVLEEVRPYLIADGGNIEVVRIDLADRDIFLRLQGACGSCPSSTTTMKMGVERVLREKFTQLGSVEAVSDAPLSVDETGTPLTERAALERKLEEKLSEILPAIRGLGASASIGGVSEEGVVKLVYQGPEKVKMGVVYALKGMQGVTDVHVV